MSVKVYSTPSCSACKMVKNYFRERHVKFTDYNVASDQRKADEMTHKSRQTGVPVIDYNGKIVIGFNREKLERLISTH